MSKEPLVSITMNCYNSDTYLKEAILSVLNGSYQNFEIIFWDNQSSDNSAKIVKSFNDKRIKYFYAPIHTPLGEARNLAIKEAKGEWVAILDCDDLWDKDKLKDAFLLLDAYPKKEEVTLLYSKTVYINEDGEIFGKFKEHYSGDIHDLLLTKGDFVFISSAIFRTDRLNEVGKIDTNLHYAEDYDILLKVTKNRQALCVDAYHTYYRVHQKNLTNSNVYEYDVENFEFLNGYIKKHNLPLNIKIPIFLNNSARMTASIVKLIAKRDFKNLWKITKGYWQYLLLSPYYLVHFTFKRVKKLLSEKS